MRAARIRAHLNRTAFRTRHAELDANVLCVWCKGAHCVSSVPATGVATVAAWLRRSSICVLQCRVPTRAGRGIAPRRLPAARSRPTPRDYKPLGAGWEWSVEPAHLAPALSHAPGHAPSGSVRLLADAIPNSHVNVP